MTNAIIPKKEKAFDMTSRNLMIGIPAYDFKVTLKLAISLAQFAQAAMQHGINMRIASICGCSVVSRARNLIAAEFLSSPCTDLLFIDADINFDPNDIFRLMAWTVDEKRGIAGGIPRTRKEEKTYIATLQTTKDGDFYMDDMGCVQAQRIATAFMMIRRNVFEKLRDEHPEWVYDEPKAGEGKRIHSFFDFKSTPQGYIGEDFLFCDRVREAGFEVWVDPTIKLGHMGAIEYMGDFGKDVFYPLLDPTEATLSDVA